MSCKFNSELLLFGQTIQKEFPPCVFGFSPGDPPFLRYFPGGEIPFPPEDIPIPQERNRPRAPIPPGTKCWFAGFIFCFERPNGLSDYDLKFLKMMMFILDVHWYLQVFVKPISARGPFSY